MSLDLGIFNIEGEVICEFNCLRNPFGLVQWTEDNCPMDEFTANIFSDMIEERGHERPQGKGLLWYVCNHWNYDNAKNVDRKVFKEVVDWYAEKLEKLEVGYFYFDENSYDQFCRGKGLLILIRENRLDITPNTCAVFNLGRIRCLNDYKEWFQKLIEIANLLQNFDNIFYCSN